MLTVLTLMSKVVFSPIWLLWQLYNGLWWAFQDDPRPQPAPARAPQVDATAKPGPQLNPQPVPDARARGFWARVSRDAVPQDPAPAPRDPSQAPRAPDQARAFEVVNSSAKVNSRQPRPLAALRGGFFGSIGISISLAYLANVMVMNHWLDPARAASSWMLASAFTFVTSLFAVRAAARRDIAQREARASRPGFIRRAVSQNRLAASAKRFATSPNVVRAAAFTRTSATRGAAACATGLRQGVSTLCSGLSKFEAKLGVPKTAAADQSPASGPASHA